MAGILIEASEVFKIHPIPCQLQRNLFLANTYRRLIRSLRHSGFIRHQYSDYCRPDSHPAVVWTTMVQLAQIESTLVGLKMHYIPYSEDLDITDQLQLGGEFSTRLRGPTPSALVANVPTGVLIPAPVIPGPGFVRPVNTRPSINANNRNNYRT